MKTISLLAVFLFGTFSLYAQQLLQEETYQFETLKKNCYLGDVSFYPEDQTTSLHYVQKMPTNTLFITYHFDEKLKFIEETQEEYSLMDGMKNTGQEVKNTFKWFTNKYKGEEYTEDRIHIYQGMGGKLIAKKYEYTYAFGWDFGRYFPKTKLIDQLEAKGANSERIYLYDWVQNNETGDAYLIVGKKADKKSKIKYQHARKFQIVKVSSDFEVEYLETIDFPHNMAISFMRVLSNEEPEESYEIDPDIPLAEDISRGPLAVVFSPVKAMIGKKNESENPEKQTLVLLDQHGKIDTKIRFTAKVSGWMIEDFVLSEDGQEVYFYGPAKEDAYVNQVMPTNSPLTGRTEIKDIKWKSFQLMKISNKEKAWIRDTDLKEFKSKAIAPPSQKQMPVYDGKKFAKTMTYLSPSGEVFIGGQEYTTKSATDGMGNSIKVIDDYKDLILFHFDGSGKLKAQYGVRRDKMNKHSKRILTPQELVLSAEGNSLYWAYGEIAGFRGGTDFLNIGGAGIGTISKSKLLYYPAVSKINMDNAQIGDFVMFGQDQDGKQLYYSHPDFSHLISPDGNYLTFIGEDKKGSVIWLGRMKL